MREAFVEHRFSPAGLDTIRTANAILTEYADQSYDLSLRQLYYQFVARGYLPNSQREYKRLGDALEPSVLADLVRRAVTRRRDEALCQQAVEHERRGRLQLERIADECETSV